MATRRRKLTKNMKGCGKCGKSRCMHKRTNKRGGCGSCSQTGGNVIFTPTPTIAGTVITAVVNVARTIQGLIPL